MFAACEIPGLWICLEGLWVLYTLVEGLRHKRASAGAKVCIREPIFVTSLTQQITV